MASVLSYDTGIKTVYFRVIQIMIVGVEGKHLMTTRNFWMLKLFYNANTSVIHINLLESPPGF